jgi:homogentisate 1,2-dioxygenase
MDLEYYATVRGKAEVKEWIDDLIRRANTGDRLAQEMVIHYLYCVERALEGMPFS